MRCVFFILLCVTSNAISCVAINTRASLVYNVLVECKSQALHSLFSKINSNKFIVKIINNEKNHHLCTENNMKIVESAMLEHEKFYERIFDRLQETCDKINEKCKQTNFVDTLEKINCFFRRVHDIKIYLVPPYNENNKTTLIIDNYIMLPMSNIPTEYYLQQIVLSITNEYVEVYKCMFNNAVKSVILDIMPLAIAYATIKDVTYIKNNYSKTEHTIAKICATHIIEYIKHSKQFDKELLEKCEHDIEQRYPDIWHNPTVLLSYKVSVHANTRLMKRVVKILHNVYQTKIISGDEVKTPVIIINEAYNYLPNELYYKYNEKIGEYIYVTFDENDRMFVFIRCNNIKQVEQALVMLKRHGEIKYEYYAEL